MSLAVENLSFAYNGRAVLHKAAFTARPGQLVAVLGCNGAGKTTLFRCILGFLKGYTGHIRIEGEEIASLSPRRLARHLAYIPQGHTLPYNYTVFETVLMGTNAWLDGLAGPGAKEEALVAGALERLQISHLAQRPVGQISGGERQLALIARAIAQRSRVLVMDEPTANLDYGNGLRVMELASRLAAEGYLILCSTHNPEHALLFANRVLVLQGGCVMHDGPPAEVLSQAVLRELYGVPLLLRRVAGSEGEIPVCVPDRVPL